MQKEFTLWDKEKKERITVMGKINGREGEWKALRPKHDDKVPSLSINERKGVYHCFGCSFEGRLVNGDGYRKSNNKPKTQPVISISKNKRFIERLNNTDDAKVFLREENLKI